MGLIDPQIRANNEHLLRCLTDPDRSVRKEAAETVSEYLRISNREDGFASQILPEKNITAANLDRQADTPDPVVVIDIEPESAGAYTVPFATGPQTVAIEAGRYPVFLKRIESKRYQSDKNRLLTWNMDIKEMFKDLLIKDISDVEDGMLMATVERIVGEAGVNQVNPLLDACQWTTQGPLTRQALSNARKGLPATNKKLDATLGLVNNLTIWDIPALERGEVGGDLAQDMFLNGMGEARVMKLDLKVTIKSDLVQTNDLYQFAAPKYMGEFLILDELVMSTELLNYMIEFWAYKCVGMAIKNIASVCKASFTDYAVDWETGGVQGSASRLPEAGGDLS